MALIEKEIIDKIEIVENNCIQIRTATIIEKDGVELTRTFHRHAINPLEDISNQHPKVQSIANAIWTPEVVEEYRKLIESKNSL